jgi:1-acyl-sn-glycerol-3-phosphate acyltransferase
MRALVSIFQITAYYASFVLFATAALVLNFLCLLAGWFPSSPGRERFFQRVVHRHFAAFVWWLRVTRIVPVRYVGFERWPRARGLVVAANHPCLMDIGFMLARVPEGVCIFKPAIGHNPLFNAIARRAGYIASDGGHHLLRDAAARIKDGSTLVIFPEGTRTKGDGLNPLKPGFVAIARLAEVPIQLVRITCDSSLLTKLGPPWWQVPRLPARITVSLGPCLPPPGPDTSAVVEEIAAWFRHQPAAVRAEEPALEPARVPAQA